MKNKKNSCTKTFLLSALALSFISPVVAQVQVKELILPKMENYKVLKCDFHVHTVFSDGAVWSTTRIDEAVEEGLDAIALTEHIEYRPKLAEFVSKDHNRSFELAQKHAANKNLLLIKGTEITRKLPPGHFNAIFIEDANRFEAFVNPNDSRDGSTIVATLEEAKRQGAFVFWNHPWFQNPKNISEWFPAHTELYNKGLIQGIEVVNGGRYDQTILDWCLDKKLTVVSTSDIHAPMVLDPGKHRPMTLVFAQERSLQSIKEALVERRTVAYSNDYLYGASNWVSLLVNASLQAERVYSNNNSTRLRLSNKSGINFRLRILSHKGITSRIDVVREISVPALSDVIFDVKQKSNESSISILFSVLNTDIGGGLSMELPLQF